MLFVRLIVNGVWVKITINGSVKIKTRESLLLGMTVGDELVFLNRPMISEKDGVSKGLITTGLRRGPMRMILIVPM